MNNTTAIKVLNTIRNIVVIIGALSTIFLIALVDNKDSIWYNKIILSIFISMGLIALGILIERITIKYFVVNKEEYKPIFYWDGFDYDYLLADCELDEDDEFLDEYYLWLQQSHKKDTDKNYEYYCKHIS